MKKSNYKVDEFMGRQKNSHETTDIPDVAKAGESYGELDGFSRAALDEYLSKFKTSTDLELVSSVGKNSSDESDYGIYLPLGDATDMRVLEVEPGNFEGEIICTLHTCSVNFEYPAELKHDISYKTYTNHAISRISGQRIWYTALSYVWGDSAIVTSISCNGKSLNVTRNLSLAIRHLRDVRKPVVLWIDQICINQEDLQEKAQQVILMAKIYHRAWSTVVWLGEAADNSDNVIETMKTISEALRLNLDERAPDPNDFERIGLPSLGSARWAELGRFFRRPWFYRVWIIQEAVLSQHVQLMCGQRLISWLDLSVFAICMIRHDLTRYMTVVDQAVGKQITSESGCMQITKIDDMKSYHQMFVTPSSLLPTLIEGRGAQATDLRDKVFAIMGMSTIMIHPDYSASIFDVYTEAARRMLAENPLGLLWCVDHEQPAEGLPSWVPDWSVPRLTTSLNYPGYHGVYESQKARKTQPKLQADGRSIVLSGIFFDTIQTLGPATTATSSRLQDVPISTSATSHFIISSLQQAQTSSCDPYPSTTIPTPLFTAFWQTLVAGKDATGKQAAPSTFAPIFALLIDSITTSCSSFSHSPFLIPPPSRSSSRSPSPSPSQTHPRSRTHNNPRPLTLQTLQSRQPARTYRDMQIALQTAVTARRFGTTSKKYMALLPRGTRVGDWVFLVGGDVPFVVRRVLGARSRLWVQGGGEGDGGGGGGEGGGEDGGGGGGGEGGGGESVDAEEIKDPQNEIKQYNLLGECYVHGIMNGEVSRHLDHELEMEMESIELI